jgi:hypothetical protein
MDTFLQSEHLDVSVAALFEFGNYDVP